MGRKTGQYRRHLKCAKQFKKLNYRKAVAAKTGATYTSPGKGAPVTVENKNFFRVTKMFTPPTRPVGQKRYPLHFRKYEIHEGRHLYRTHKKADTLYISVPPGKKDTKYLIGKSINQSPKRLPRLNGGSRGRKRVFPPTKDKGKRVGD